MVRLNIVVEGQSEQQFVTWVLAKHLCAFQVDANATCVRTSKKPGGQGGAINFEHLDRHLRNRMQQEKTQKDVRFACMFDLYRIPKSFPGYDASRKLTDPIEQAECIENAMQTHFSHPHFFPYIQVHEFEALLLSQPNAFAEVIDDEYSPALTRMFTTIGDIPPERINDGENTHPAARILNAFPGYKKITDGIRIAKTIGIQRMRDRCTHFGQWVTKLEKTSPV